MCNTIRFSKTMTRMVVCDLVPQWQYIFMDRFGTILRFESTVMRAWLFKLSCRVQCYRQKFDDAGS